MFNYKGKYSILFRTIALVLVCLFIVNDTCLAQVCHSPSASSTLAIQSIFSPIINAVGMQHEKQVEFELSAIIAMALMGLKRDNGNPNKYKSPLNINSILDKRCSDSGREDFVERTLEITGIPAVSEDNPDKSIVIYVKTVSNPKNQKHFKIIFKGDKLEDMFDRTKIEVVEKQLPVTELEIASDDTSVESFETKTNDVSITIKVIGNYNIQATAVVSGKSIDLIKDSIFVYDDIDATKYIFMLLETDFFSFNTGEGVRRRKAVDWWSRFFSKHRFNEIAKVEPKKSPMYPGFYYTIGVYESEKTLCGASITTHSSDYPGKKDIVWIDYCVVNDPFSDTGLPYYFLKDILNDTALSKSYLVEWREKKRPNPELDIAVEKLWREGRMERIFSEQTKYGDYVYFAIVNKNTQLYKERLPDDSAIVCYVDNSRNVYIYIDKDGDRKTVVCRNRASYDVTQRDIDVIKAAKLFSPDGALPDILKSVRLGLAGEDFLDYLRGDLRELMRENSNRARLPDSIFEVCRKNGFNPVDVVKPVLDEISPFTPSSKDKIIEYYQILINGILDWVIPGVESRLSNEDLREKFNLKAIEDFEKFAQQLWYPTSQAFCDYMNAADIFTNSTKFFRESNVFQFFGKTVLPDLVRQKGRGSVIRVLSVGCSYGCEPYTLAIIALENIHLLEGCVIEITGIDINEGNLKSAEIGGFSEDDVKDVPKHLLEKYFIYNAAEKKYFVKDEVKQLVKFKKANLINPDHRQSLGQFECIFSRHVFNHYYSEDKLEIEMNMLNSMLVPGGYISDLYSVNPSSSEFIDKHPDIYKYKVYSPLRSRHMTMHDDFFRQPVFEEAYFYHKAMRGSVYYTDYPGCDKNIAIEEKLRHAINTVYYRPAWYIDKEGVEDLLRRRFLEQMRHIEPASVSKITISLLVDYVLAYREGKNPVIKVNSDKEVIIADKASLAKEIKPNDISISNELLLLNRASAYLKDYPVDEVIDLSLIPKEDLEENMKTWAYIIAINNKHGLNINYIFKSGDETYKAKAKKILFEKISELKGIDIEAVKSRVTDVCCPGALQIHIMKKEDLERLKDIPEDVLPVALSEGTTLDGTPLRDFISASTIGIAQAAVKRMQIENSPHLLEILEQEILPRMQHIYQRLFPDKDIKEIVTKETILNMIDDNPIVKRNLALALALPPIIRVAIQYLKDYHERLHLLQQAA